MMRRSGFTLLETVLAVVIGGAVLIAALGLFALMSRSETFLDRRFEQTRQLGTLQLVMRRSFNTILMSEDNKESLETQDPEQREELGNGEVQETKDPAWDGDGNRPRIVLDYDDSADLQQMLALAPLPADDQMGPPQRLEMVLPRSPIPPALRLPTQGWLNQGVDIENDLEVYGISGAVRGIFELRPDGSREAFLKSHGMTPATGERLRREDEHRGWTLWWRPMFPEEIARLQAGEPETEQTMLRNAAEAYPILRGIKHCRFLAFDNRYRKPVYAARTATDLPAYVEVEIETWSGLYANWMFEVGWLNGADPTIAEDQTADQTGADQAGQDEAQDQNGGQGGALQQRRLDQRHLEQRALTPKRLERPGSPASGDSGKDGGG